MLSYLVNRRGGTPSGASRTGRRGQRTRQSRGYRLCLGLVGVLLALEPDAARTQPVQASPSPTVPVLWRLSVRPREVATGTRTERAGPQQLEVWKGLTVFVYVPPKCVGTQRCPLVACMGFRPECDQPGSEKLADEYGMITFRPTMHYPESVLDGWGLSVDPGVPYLVRETSSETDHYVREMDATLTRILQSFAIDPEKIAIFGNSSPGLMTALLGSANPDVFSRIAPRTGYRPFEGPIPPPRTTQFLFMGAGAEIGEPNNAIVNALFKRKEGYPVTIVIAPMLHTADIVEEANVFRWFHDSWADPVAARRAARPQRVTPVPLLTTSAVTQWTTFWTLFMNEPDSIRDTARVAHIKEVPMLIGREPVLTLITDIPALAAKYPSVAADLKAAGLTARQAEAYRIALFSTWLTLRVQKRAYGDVGTVAPTSVLGKNMAFLGAQPDLLKTLSAVKSDEARSWVNTP